jgi:hypothetical protein
MQNASWKPWMIVNFNLSLSQSVEVLFQQTFIYRFSASPLKAGELSMSVLSMNEVRRLSLGFPVLDDVFPGLEFGDFAVLHGSSVSFMFSTLSVRCQLPFARDGLDSSTVFVDGGNMFNPYLIAEIARSYGLDSRIVLEKVYVSRAFTAYQLSSLILEKLESALKRRRARLLIVSDVTSLFLDRDLPKVEARELFMKVCVKLSEIASERQTIIVVGYFPEKRSRQISFFEAFLFGKCNVLIRLRKIGKILSFALEDYARINPFTMDFTVDSASLALFCGGVDLGENRSVL